MTKIAQPFCSDISIEAEEALAGTAPPTEIYVLLEYNGAWGEKALDESDIPTELKARLKALQKGNPLVKVLLIRSTRSLIQPGIRFFVAQTSAGRAEIFDFHVAAYEDLLDLDIAAILDGAPDYQRNRRKTPLYLVCTNGRRDRCCALYGTEIFNTLLQASQQDPEFIVWQCSHIAGHRFAANLIALPAGLLYGRVRPEDVPAILAAGLEGRIHLPNLRGRSVYPQPAQAAEVALRRALDESRLEAIRLIEIEPDGPENWRMHFERMDGERYAVHVQERDTGRLVFESCQLDKQTQVKEYVFQIEEAAR